MKDEAEIYEKLNLQKKFILSKKPKSIDDFFHAEEHVIENLGKIEDCVLDAGCGTGRHLKLISRKIKAGVGIDCDSRAIKEAKRNNGGIKNLKFIVANIYNIPFPKDYFSLVLCLNHTLGNLPKHKPAIKEMLRVLRPNGKLILTAHNNKIKDDKIAWYKKCGLKKPIYSEKISAVITQEGFYSYCFKKDYLHNLFNQFRGASFEISNLTPYSYLCTIRKKRRIN